MSATLSSPPRSAGLGSLVWRYRGRLGFTYALFVLENGLRLAQPLLLGWAINDLLAAKSIGLFAFAGGHLLHLAIRTFRQMYDTRALGAIYAERAAEVVVAQRDRGETLSRVSARSSLSQRFIDFLERSVPLAIRSLFSLVGGCVLLAWFDPWLVLLCFGLAIPAFSLNWFYGRRAFQLSKLLHGELEREVDVIDQGGENDVRGHYTRVVGWQVRLSDAEAVTVAVMEFFVLALIVAALMRYCSLPGITAGGIFAVFRYLMMYIMAFDAVPPLVQQWNRLRDISRRIAV
ncbi:MAG: ABC transporter six-transmembrane domain-containing protein [bacterium]|nr:ABC transporter six-transmembrane domain-containing protein [bacterium]